MNLVLASMSKSRAMILEKLQLPFEIMPADIDESVWQNEAPEQHALRLAIGKAEKIAELKPDSLIIGADSVAVINNEIVSKPETHENAVKQLEMASGQCISFHTGLCVINSKTFKRQTAFETIRVYFKPLTRSMIENYLAKDKPYHCAGSIKAEGLGIALIEKFDCHDPNALIGLPLIKLIEMLGNEGFSII